MKSAVVGLVQRNAKAIVAFVVALVAVQFAKRGLALDVNATDGLQAFLSAIVSGCLVWLTSNKQ